MQVTAVIGTEVISMFSLVPKKCWYQIGTDKEQRKSTCTKNMVSQQKKWEKLRFCCSYPQKPKKKNQPLYHGFTYKVTNRQKICFFLSNF